jgi:3-oxoadipate enol-lactonase
VPYYEANHLKLFYEDQGSGPPLVLLHGFGQHGALCWLDLTPIYERFFRVLTLDMRGCGLSEASAPGYSAADLASDVIALIEHLELGRIHFAGWSLGGAAGIELGIGHSDRLLSLSLHSTWAGGRLPQQKLWMTMRQRAILSGDPELSATMRVLGYFGSDFINAHPERVDEFMKRELVNPFPISEIGVKGQLGVAPSYDARERLHLITAPTLVTTGSADRTILPSQSRFIHERVQGSEYVLFDGAGHFPLFQMTPEFASLTIGFMMKHSGP